MSSMFAPNADNWLDGSLPDAWAEPDGAFAANLTILDLSNNTLIGGCNLREPGAVFSHSWRL